MSFRLGISHSPVQHRQLTSPKIEQYPEPPVGNITEDSKDVLIERLNDLVLRLSKVSLLEDGAFSAIHKEVETIELLVDGVEKSNSPSQLLRADSGYSEADDFWGPSTPTRNIKIRLPVMSTYKLPSPKLASKSKPDKAIEVAQAAEELSAKLSCTLAQLINRKVESDRIHDLLVMRNEKAAEHILVLEDRFAEMEEDQQSSQSELKFLRIQLQAIQVQCMNCIHRHEDDPELTDSINKWKIDWEAINKRAKAPRQKGAI
ncbi:uncharacterized protein RSE6_04220 [Rhynchosporium secalis]|uniref:Uncharacterized protein n=1 Tax=Rhynchosporium secalis TaxID=38038 RepID=A0A1E1M674_RHYSE|nr:uncharacterized protein RSE6_04220 [Rhynchosporium secalis]